MFMKIFKTLPLALAGFLWCGCGDNVNEPVATSTVKNQVVDSKIFEVSCGQCKFGLKGEGCHLAIKLDDGACFVDGVDIGDPVLMHKPGGYCVMIRKAKVSGQVVNHRFQAKAYELLPLPADHKF
jgi:hypothetical protein